MASNLEIDAVRKEQAAHEAVELLNQAGFIVEGFNSSAKGDGSYFNLNVTLAIGQNERPLEALEG